MTAHEKAIKASITDLNEIIYHQKHIGHPDSFFSIVYTAEMWRDQLSEAAARLAKIAAADPAEWNAAAAIADAELAEADHPRHSICR